MSNRHVTWATLAGLSLAACATPGPVLTESVGTIRTGVALADEQAAASFKAANSLALEIAIERKVGLPETSLRENDFPAAVDLETIAKWEASFNLLDRYLAGLQKLVDPSRADATGTGLSELAEEMQDGAMDAKLPVGVGPVVAALGRAIVQIGAERKAQMVLRRTDPAFQQVTAAMADAIGADDNGDLRGTVRNYWTNKFGESVVAYGRISPDAKDERRAVIADYLKLIDARNADLARLRTLRTSILALGEAHAAAARGDAGTALYWIGRVSDWVKATKESIEKEKEARENG